MYVNEIRWINEVLVMLLIVAVVTYDQTVEATRQEPGVLWDMSGHKAKRSVHRDMVGFMPDEKTALLDRHNAVRRKTMASDMLRMRWDDQLEQSAQAWANRCSFSHSTNREQLAGFQYVGENLYAGTGSFQPESVVQMWYDEVVDYDYNTLRCRPAMMCGHYTQVVWADTSSVGCGVRYCSQLRGSSSTGFSQGYIVVCHYGPGGNYVGQRPYTRGAPCSQCPRNANVCSSGLCVSGEGIYKPEVHVPSVSSGNGAQEVDDKGILGFKYEQRRALLDRHNKLRGQEMASDMLRMRWDDQLERSAQAWANRCSFSHSTNREQLAGFQYVGENLYAGTGAFLPESVVQMWYDEVEDYDYNTLRCRPGKMCGHYTQVVWADTSAVGCAVRYCPQLRGSSSIGFSQGYIVVCHYGPGGNYIGQKPYTYGSHCSKCPETANICSDRLCADKFYNSGPPAGFSSHTSVLATCVFLAILLHRATSGVPTSVLLLLGRSQ